MVGSFDALFCMFSFFVAEMIAEALDTHKPSVSQALCMRLGKSILKKQNARIFYLLDQSELVPS